MGSGEGIKKVLAEISLGKEVTVSGGVEAPLCARSHCGGIMQKSMHIKIKCILVAQVRLFSRRMRCFYGMTLLE